MSVEAVMATLAGREFGIVYGLPPGEYEAEEESIKDHDHSGTCFYGNHYYTMDDDKCPYIEVWIIRKKETTHE